MLHISHRVIVQLLPAVSLLSLSQWPTEEDVMSWLSPSFRYFLLINEKDLRLSRRVSTKYYISTASSAWSHIARLQVQANCKIPPVWQTIWSEGPLSAMEDQGGNSQKDDFKRCSDHRLHSEKELLEIDRNHVRTRVLGFWKASHHAPISVLLYSISFLENTGTSAVSFV
jgi:hypothetical protein